MNRKLFTIGYAGLSVSDLVTILIRHEIEYVIDIRELPISRKAGFSKSAFAQQLKTSRIGYEHLKMLGSPRLLRRAVRETGDYVQFFAGVRKHLEGANSREQLVQAIQLARQRRSCLLCYCGDWQFCHRRCVVDAINNVSYFALEHLSNDKEDHRKRRAA